MPTRTTMETVRELIETDDKVPMRPFIRTASLLVDQVEKHDTKKQLPAELLEEIEAWLAAHFYAHRDQSYAQRSEGKASATFQGQTAMMLTSTQHGQTAMMLDITGYLAQLNEEAKNGGKFKVGLAWLGKPYVDQRSSRERGGRR